MKVKLGEIADQIRGVTYKADDVEETLNDNSIILLRANNISNNGMINYNDIIYVKKNKVDSDQLIKKNDILICASSGSVNLVGKAAQIKEDKLLSFGAFCKVIRPKNIHAIYLGYFFQSPYYRKKISSLAQGANINNIRNDDIDNLMINIYDDAKTQKIVAVLDKVTILISRRKEQLEKLDILVKSKFIEMFGDPVLNPKGWEKEKLGEVCDVNPNKDIFKCIDDGVEISFIPMDNVSVNGSINTNIIKKYYEVKNGYSYFKENDVLFAKITPCMENGKSAVAKNLKNGLGVGSTEFHVLRPNTNYINSVWLYNLIHFKWFRLIAENKMTGSAGQRRVPPSFLSDFKTIIPPIDLQNQFAEFVEQVEKNKENIKLSLNQLETLYNALMQEYFG